MPATSRPLKMSYLFYHLSHSLLAPYVTYLVSISLSLIGPSPPLLQGSDLVDVLLLTEGILFEDAQLHHGP